MDYTHTDLAGNVITSGDYDFVNNDGDAMDDEGHGTHVAGVIAAVGNNAKGIAGVCWNCKILPVKVLNADGGGDDYDIADGIRYAADNGARIINMSFGGIDYPPSYGSTLELACQYAYDRGCILFGASGNGYDQNDDGASDGVGMEPVSYPAGFSTVVAVGASNQSDDRASFSNYGSKLDVVAPGVGILSTYPSSIYSAAYIRMDGTSQATPFVCGLAGLILSKDIDLTQNEVKDKIRNSCDDIGPDGIDIYTGRGRINAYGALTWKQPPSVVKAANYPNPFNPSEGEKTIMSIPGDILGTTAVVYIYNLAGERVSVLDKPGEVESSFAQWDGKSDSGDILSTGIYFYMIETDKGKAKGKITLTK